MYVTTSPALAGAAAASGAAAAGGAFTGGGGGVVHLAHSVLGTGATTLPFTGANTLFTALAGMTLVFTGTALVRIGRTARLRTDES